jgi:gas vesicle protein
LIGIASSKARKTMSRGNGLPGTISLFAIGVAVGAALGVLFAPKSGEQTREIIADSVQEELDNAVLAGRKLARTARRAVDQTTEHVKEAVEIGERAFNGARGT